MLLVQLWQIYNFSAQSIPARCFPCSLGVRCAHVSWVMFKIFEFPLPCCAQPPRPLGNPMLLVQLWAVYNFSPRSIPSRCFPSTLGAPNARRA